MSRLGDLFLLGQRVSIAAKEEASRYDHPQIDLDHLLLALLVGGGPAGELLRAQGLTLDAARRATEKVRADHIARLGVVPPAAAPRPIRDPSIGEIVWAPRALKVVNHNDERGELGLLAGLLDDPSRLAAEVLTEGGVDLDALRRALAESRPAAPPTRVTAPADPGWTGVTHGGFVPAPVGDVWALVADPARRPEWDHAVGTVSPIGPEVWETTAATTQPDGRPAHPRPGSVRAHHRLTAYEPEKLVEWEVTLPDQQRGWPVRQRLRIGCAPVAGGTTVELTLCWPRRRGWRRLRQLLLTPASRTVITLTLVHYVFAISRRLR